MRFLDRLLGKRQSNTRPETESSEMGDPAPEDPVDGTTARAATESTGRAQLDPISWYPSADRAVHSVSQVLDLLAVHVNMQPPMGLGATDITRAADSLFGGWQVKAPDGGAIDICDFLAKRADRHEVIADLTYLIRSLREIAEEFPDGRVIEATEALVPVLIDAQEELLIAPPASASGDPRR